jgi:hypothetical protein
VISRLASAARIAIAGTFVSFSAVIKSSRSCSLSDANILVIDGVRLLRRLFMSLSRLPIGSSLALGC